jgi:hypothetical protein
VIAMNKKEPTAPMLVVRLPLALRAWIVEEAGRNRASYNSEVVRCVRERMERERLAAVIAKAKEKRAIAAAAAAE